MTNYKTSIFPRSRIATNDVCALGVKKHHIAALIEVDVTDSRKKIRLYKKDTGNAISFTAWLIKVISRSIEDYENVASFLQGKRKLIIFNDVNVSLAVEKNIGDQKVPIPLIIEKANGRSLESITRQINDAKNLVLSDKDIVLQNKSNKLERFYYRLPGFLRRYFWRYLLRHPGFAFAKMGNVAITSLGMVGKANGWFIPISVHPICFGIGKITKKPVVRDDQIVIREILNLTVLLDHDIMDGAQMARFINDLSINIEKGQDI
ncbi:MAG: 2-oxo acid dehydrogenase subunit E2 [Bacteroidales bacterium]|nr:2-oxo acid dehydrogenase subunit E2 [Bacteroidales bacterium]